MKQVEKINKKSSIYSLTTFSNNKNYAFIIDASLGNNKDHKTMWYVLNLKMALKKFLLSNDPKDAMIKASRYVHQNFKSYFKKFPYVSVAICKKCADKLQILTINGAKCFVKDKKIFLFEDKDFKIEKKTNKFFKNIADSNNYIYKEISYKKAFSFLLCNDSFVNYQRYLEFDNNKFYSLVSEQGIRYCTDNLIRTEKKDKDLSLISRLNYLEDIVAIYKILL